MVEEPMGTRLMFSTPEATTRSYAPAITPWAAKCAACCEEPHCRSTVVAGTSSGNPAASHALRPTFRDCSPTCDTQPVMLSSTSAGSTPERSTTSFSTVARRSTGWVPASDPFRLPMGLRTASTMTASRMVRLLPSSGAVFAGFTNLPNGNKRGRPLYARPSGGSNGLPVRVGRGPREGVARAVGALGQRIRRPRRPGEVEGLVEIPGLAVPPGELGQAPVVLDEPQHAGELAVVVVDESLLCVRRDHQQWHADPQA